MKVIENQGRLKGAKIRHENIVASLFWYSRVSKCLHDRASFGRTSSGEGASCLEPEMPFFPLVALRLSLSAVGSLSRQRFSCSSGFPFSTRGLGTHRQIRMPRAMDVECGAKRW
jgi:hypothetical protein